MKKRILLISLMVALFVCLFVLSASAKRVENYDAEYTLKTTESFNRYEKWYYNDGKSYVRKSYTDTITMTFIDKNGDTLTKVPMWEYDEEDGRYYSLVWYISAYEYVTEDGTYTDDNVGTQTYKVYKSATYTLSKARAVDLRYYTYNSNRSNSNIPSWTENRSLITLEGIYLTNGTPDDTTDDIKLQDAVGIGRDADNYGYVGWEAQFNGTGDKIVVANFRDCTFECDMEGNYGTANTWSSAYHLQCLWYPDTMKYISGGVNSLHEIDLGDGMEIIACQILRDNKNVKEIVIPNSVLYLGNEAFRGSDLTKLTVGEGLVKHGGSPFLYTGGSDNVYLSKNALKVLISSIPSLIANHSATIYFDGNLEQAEELMASIIASDGNYNNKITLVDYNTTKERGSIKNVCIFYNYNRCEAFYYNQHQDDGNGCVDYCARCELLAQKEEEEKEHSYITDSIVYVDISNVGVKTFHCQNEHCTHSTAQTLEAKAIFVYNGFSTNKDSSSFCIGYIINQEAYAEYKSANSSVAFGYGLVATSAALTTTPIGNDGNRVSEKVIQAKISEREDANTYFALDLILLGDFTNDVNATASLGMALYVTKTTIADGEAQTTVSYINSTGEASTIEAVTYAEKAPEIKGE